MADPIVIGCAIAYLMPAVVLYRYLMDDEPDMPWGVAMAAGVMWLPALAFVIVCIGLSVLTGDW